MALVGAGVILSALALFVATPGAAAVSRAGALLAVRPLTSTRPPTRRLPARVVAPNRQSLGRPLVGSGLASGGVFARTVGEVRHVVGIMLRVALGYLGPSKIRGMGSRPLGANPNDLGLVAVDDGGGADGDTDGDTEGQSDGPED